MRRRRVGVLLAVLLGALALSAAAGAAQPSQGQGAAAKPLPVRAKAWALIDGRTGEVLASHAGAARLPIASATKLMTAYVALKGVPPGRRSAAELNRYAAALGLTDTHFAGSGGGDGKGSYSSALDLATLTKELEKLKAFAKTGAAREAGLGIGRKGGVRLIAAVVGAPTEATRRADVRELLGWGFRQYDRRKALRQGQVLATPSIRYAGGELPLRVARPLTVGLRDGQKAEVEVDAPSQVSGPIRRGARLGSATVSVDGLRAGSVVLVASRAVPAANSFDKVRGFIDEHPVPLAVAACAILVAAILLGRSFRRIRRGKRVQKK